MSVLGHPGDPVTGGTVQLAAYVGARELPMAVMLLVLLLMRSNRVLPAVMLLFAASNGLDAIDALAYQRWAQLPGAAVFALAFRAAASWLCQKRGQAQSRVA